MTTPRILIAGGGTGGHLFPGVSIAGTFMERFPGARVLFVNTGRPLDRAILEAEGLRLKTVSAGGIKGVGPMKKLLSLGATARGVMESIRIIRDFGPHLVVGMGSYSAAPVVVAARLLGVKVVLHEQNILPGVANRLLAPLAERIFISFKETGRFFRPEKTSLTGNPVREAILSAKPPEGKGDRFTILVLGGSQGARGINNAVTQALPLLAGGNYRFIHQTGPEDEARIRSLYRSLGVTATVQGFFDNMGEIYAGADLIVARSGATTVAEITALGKPALFIPFPHATDNHQELNVGHLVDSGACRMIREEELSGKTLAKNIEAFAASPALLSSMAKSAKKEGCPDAAGTIVDHCCRLMGDSRLPAREAGA